LNKTQVRHLTRYTQTNKLKI